MATLEIANDVDAVVSGTQRVNVGEHVRLKLRVLPAGTTYTIAPWLITGSCIREWSITDAEPIAMTANDYAGDTLHFQWRETTQPGTRNTVRATVFAASELLTATVEFEVVRHEKPEKYYSNDLLMEYHNNWHTVYMFSSATTRRGDLFLAWHRSQLEYFNLWRAYFGHGPVPEWEPTTPWTTASGPVSRQHPTTVAPVAGFSSRHDLTTLDLTQQGLQTSTEGQYDLVTASRSRGTRARFVAAGYTLRTETVFQLMGAPAHPTLARTGIATRPTFWQAGNTATTEDPWFAAGCPVTGEGNTCAVQVKRKLEDYTLRQLGESIESGWYASDFRVNYHALGHIAPSVDMEFPITSMRDPIFWGWHRSIDRILTDWQATRGAEAHGPVVIYGQPTFNAGWSTVRVAFSHRVLAEFVKPKHVTVNGSAATSVTDVSLNGTGYIFEFSGFTVPAPGTVVVTVRREVDNHIRTTAIAQRPAVALIMSTFGNLLTPHIQRFSYTRP